MGLRFIIIRITHWNIVTRLVTTLINLTVTMNQRSVSVNRKLKTDLHQDISFDKKVARAMQEKKQTISKMFTPRNHCLPSYRNTHTHLKNKHQPTSILNQKPLRQIKLSQETLTNYLQNHNKNAEYCIVHPGKRGAFEDKERRTDVYCHECAIKMVKNNHRMVGISDESTLFKCFLDSQLHSVRQQELKVQELVREYYNSIRTMLQVCYKEFIDNKQSSPSTVAFAEFQPNSCNLNRVTEYLGKLQEIKFKIAPEVDKENIAKQLNKGRNSIERKDQKAKKLPLEVRVQLNRSYQTNSTNIGGPQLFKSRENSFCGKGDRGETKKISNFR